MYFIFWNNLLFLSKEFFEILLFFLIIIWLYKIGFLQPKKSNKPP